MKIEKLSKGKKKVIILPLLMISLIIGILYITNSKAKYQVTKNVQIVNGNVNYSLGDFNLMAVKLQNTDEYGNGIKDSYKSGDIPTEGYKLLPMSETNSDTSHCEIDNHILKGITAEYKNGNVNFYGITKQKTKCYLYFDVGAYGLDKILSDNTQQEGQQLISRIDAIEHNGIIYKGLDDDGTTYYFRGKVNDNWVKFGKDKNQKDMYWRIIRINGNGSIRMIYTGSGSATTNDNGYTSQGDQTNITNEVNDIAKVYAYNDGSERAEYVGFKYAIGSQRGTTNKSNALIQLETWFKDNMIDELPQLDTEAGFCNDRTAYFNTAGTSVGSGMETSVQYFGGYNLRNYPNGTTISDSNPAKPSFKCPEDSDLFTVSGSSKGNGQLTYPVGLITADEVTFAGGLYGGGKNNTSFYLYTGQTYWTITPSRFEQNNKEVDMLVLFSDGRLADQFTRYGHGLRPVINLSKYISYNGGDGTSTHPYILN